MIHYGLRGGTTYIGNVGKYAMHHHPVPAIITYSVGKIKKVSSLAVGCLLTIIYFHKILSHFPMSNPGIYTQVLLMRFPCL